MHTELASPSFQSSGCSVQDYEGSAGALLFQLQLILNASINSASHTLPFHIFFR